MIDRRAVQEAARATVEERASESPLDVLFSGATLLGCSSVVFLYLLGLAILLLGFVVFGLRAPGELFSLGQLVADCLLLPIVVFGFVIAIEQFRKSQEVPRLDLYWQKGEESIPGQRLEAWAEESRAELGIVLVNRGNAVTVWYLVEIFVPRYEDASVYVSSSNVMSPVWSFRDIRGGRLNSFMSKGEVASYPGHEVPIADVSIWLDSYLSIFQTTFDYTIVSDRGRRKQGRLHLLLRQRPPSLESINTRED